MKLHVLVQSMRPPFLILAPICVLLGVGSVIASQGRIDWGQLALVLLGALLSHISVNTLNEYQDFKSGLDLITLKTPFSGGSGALPANPEMAGLVGLLGVSSLLGVGLIGLILLWQGRVELVPVGLLGLLLIGAYSGWINRHPLLCLIAPGLGFGFLMVGGTYLALATQHSLLPWLVAAVPFFLTNNLLLLNQYPDIGADRQVGRQHLPITRGTGFSSWVYGGFLLTTLVLMLGAIAQGLLPTLSLIALLPLPLGLFALSGAYRYGERLGDHPRYLAANVMVALVTPLLLGLSLLFA